MFFIPVAAVVLFIWFIVYCVQSARESKFRYDLDRDIQRTQSLESMTRDDRMEREFQNARMHGSMQGSLSDNDDVSRFMGGGREWEEYARSEWFLKLKAVRMAKCGKIPHEFSDGIGYHLGMLSDSNMSEEMWAGMNVRFLLRLEEELQAHSVPAVALFQHQFPTGPWTRLRETVQREGTDCTKLTTKFRFTYDDRR